MLLQDQLTEYVKAVMAYDAEAKDVKDAKKEFKASFMARTGAGKAELAFLDKAIQINKKLETDHEINDFMTFVEKVSQLLSRTASESLNNQEDDEPMGEQENVQMELEIDGKTISTSTDILKKAANMLAEKEFKMHPPVNKSAPKDWNPPPAPVIPSSKK